MLHLIKTSDNVINLDQVARVWRSPSGGLLEIKFSGMNEGEYLTIYDDEAEQVWEYLSVCCLFTTQPIYIEQE